MEAYRTFVTVVDPHQIVLEDVPFQPGQRVEILVMAQGNQTMQVNELRALFRATQSLPQVRVLSDEEIAAEVAAYRSGQ